MTTCTEKKVKASITEYSEKKVMKTLQTKTYVANNMNRSKFITLKGLII